MLFKEWFLIEAQGQDELMQLGNAAYFSEKSGNTTSDTMLSDMSDNGGLQEIGQRFDAHGMGKCRADECLKNLYNLLTKGIQGGKDFYTAPLDVPDSLRQAMGAGLGTAGGVAIRGAFILVSNIDKPLKDGIRYVIVSEPYYDNGKVDGIQLLKSLFPNVEFIKSSDAVNFFKSVAASSPKNNNNKQQISLRDVLKQNGIEGQQDPKDPQTIIIPSKNVKIKVGRNYLAIIDATGKQIKVESLSNYQNALKSIINTLNSIQ